MIEFCKKRGNLIQLWAKQKAGSIYAISGHTGGTGG